MSLLALYGSPREALALAPVVQAARAQPRLLQVTTAAVGDAAMLAEPALAALGLTTHYTLPVDLSPGAPPQQQLAHVLEAVAPFLAEQEPGVALVAGYGWTAAAAAVLGGYRRILLAHVDAGRRWYRSGRQAVRQPRRGAAGPGSAGFGPAGVGPAGVGPPDFHHRLLAAGAHIHLAATALARGNLLRAGVPPEGVFVTGSPLVDAALRFQAGSREPAGLEEQDPAPETGLGGGRRLVLALVDHEHIDGDSLAEFYRGLAWAAREAPGHLLVVEEPARRDLQPLAARHLASVPGINVVPPMTWRRRWRLLAGAYCAVTPGGAAEEEGPCFGVPVLIMAGGTSRPEMVELGGSRLTGGTAQGLARQLTALLADPGLRRVMAKVPNPYGDGRAAGRILQAILHRLGRAPAPPPPFGSPGRQSLPGSPS